MNNELSMLYIEEHIRTDMCRNSFNVNNYNDNCNHNVRECVNNDTTSFSNTRNNICFCDKNIYENNKSLNNIYRYKFTDNFTCELLRFSKIHQYDHRKDFKEAWDIWIEENAIIVEEEIRRLQNLGYIGDIKEKMFKSSRYYFRKKSTEKKAPKKRRDYVGVKKELLEIMDNHIKIGILDKTYKPSIAFNDFCKNNVELLKEEVNILFQHGFTEPDEIKRKIKKTYKNRYYLINK